MASRTPGCQPVWISALGADHRVWSTCDGSRARSRRSSYVKAVAERSCLACGAGDVALEAADDLFLGFALGGAPGGVGLGAWVAGQAGHGDGPQRGVGLPVAKVHPGTSPAGCGIRDGRINITMRVTGLD